MHALYATALQSGFSSPWFHQGRSQHHRSQADGSVGAAPSFHQNTSSASPSSCPQQHEGNEMHTTLRENHGFNRGEQSANWRHASTTSECADWLKEQLRPTPAKVVSRQAGINQRAAEAVKLGRNGLTMAHLVNMCRADAKFRSAFFAFCGGHLEGDPEFVAGLTLAVQSFMRNSEAGK